MKKLVLLLASALFLSTSAFAQESDDIKPAAKGVVYGEAPSASGQAIAAGDVQSRLVENYFEGKITGKVKEVCKAMGCWITVEKADGTTLMVKSKDHAFFMPQNLVGHTVIIEGTAAWKEVSESKRKHLAEDAGKSKEEIEKIKGSSKELQFIAKGIQVID